MTAYRKHPATEPPLTGIVRDDDLIIPADPLNVDWQAYQAWLKAGHAPAEPTPAGTAPAVTAAKT